MHSAARALIFSRPAVLVTLLVSFVLVASSVALSVYSTRTIAAADSRTARAQQAVVVINQLLATMNEAETAQRGYLLTHDDKYLAPYEAARPRYRDEVAELARQYAGDPADEALVRQISILCDQRFAEIARTIRLRREHGMAPALNVIESDEGWRLMNDLRKALRGLQRQELTEISTATTHAAAEAKVLQNLNGGLLAVATVLAFGAAVVVIRRLHQLEGLIKVCAWTQRVQLDGQWITFEEYLAKRFNLHVTHGISDEAARELGREIENTPVPPDL